MNITLAGSSVICKAAAGETILLACSRCGIFITAACGGRNRCGKCTVQLLEGQVVNDTPDSDGMVRSCLAVPLGDITIACPAHEELNSEETAASVLPVQRPQRAAVALDIGTTTISARLIDMDRAAVLATISELNDQRAFGADVMSRIAAAKNGSLSELFIAINRQTERIIRSFQQRFSIDSIEKLAVSGNTVMLHLFLNIDPSGMGELPFTPVFLEEKKLTGESLSLSVHDIIVLPSIAAFIGADVSAGLAILDLAGTSGTSLLVDIGTNGEMALCHRGEIFCCSTAAGPAFEGAEIVHGMGGVKGAISAVALADTMDTDRPRLAINTIGNVVPRGICGSGLVDAVALMLKLGIIDETGFMPCKEFFLTPDISITGRDIRQYQLAKSAIYSGIKILCARAGVRLDAIQQVYIAGGLGFFINKQSAVDSGIFPQEFLKVLTVSGNISLQGAEKCLLDNDFLSRCRQIIERCTIIDLASDPAFMDEFADNMLFAVNTADITTL